MSIDTTRPHISRIYDYVLGGTYNHEADRRAAEVMIERMPSYPRWARQNRWFLAHVGELWASQGRGQVLDLGSGLPTNGHLNAHLPDARILFVDHDPQTAAQGREILGTSPTMEYAEIDIRQPDALVTKAGAFFGQERSLAIGLIGVLYFLSDDQLRSLARELHAFSAPGSTLAASFPSVLDRLTEEETATIRALEKVAQIAFFHRTPEEVAELLKPWKVVSTQEITASPDTLGPTDPAKDPMHRFRVVGILADHA